MRSYIVLGFIVCSTEQTWIINVKQLNTETMESSNKCHVGSPLGVLILTGGVGGLQEVSNEGSDKE